MVTNDSSNTEPRKPTPWRDTIASRCRYGDVAATIWGDWDVLWEDSENDYQGHASFFAVNKDRTRFAFYEWSYGSCSGCDGWEADELTNEQIAAEMQERAAWFDGWYEADNFFDRIAEVRGALGVQWWKGLTP